MCSRTFRRRASSVNRSRNRAFAATPPPQQSVWKPVLLQGQKRLADQAIDHRFLKTRGQIGDLLVG